MITDDQRRTTARHAQAALRDDVTWVQQPAFDKAWSDITGEPIDHDEWRREVNWNFTGDDVSFTQ